MRAFSPSMRRRDVARATRPAVMLPRLGTMAHPRKARSTTMSGVKILVAQGGGPTAVINQSLVGVVLESRRFKNVERVYGARHGVRGIINEDLVDLTQETVHNLEAVAATPASAL